MRNRFDRQLDALNDELISMGSMIEQAIEKAVGALIEKDADLARQAIEIDAQIDEQERQIERRCLKLLLHQQPVATDLRFISTALKMITDMERIGDQASDISEIVIRFVDNIYIKRILHIPMMARATIKMVNESVDAFVERNLELAQSVVDYDDVVDDLFDVVKGELIDLIREDAANGEQAIELLMIAKYFERIGDHAVNIAQWVMFAITGKHMDEKVPR